MALGSKIQFYSELSCELIYRNVFLELVGKNLNFAVKCIFNFNAFVLVSTFWGLCICILNM